MQIFGFNSYKTYVQQRIENMPSRGRGEFSRLAQALQMHTTSVSQVFSGEKDLTLEQAARLTQTWGMSELESDYFVNLVELERAGAAELKAIIKKRLAKLKKQSTDLVNLVPKDRVLSEADRGIFYSSWAYSAIRLVCDIPEYNSVDKIAARLDLSLSFVTDALDFLVRCGLVVHERGHYKMGPQRTFIEASSPLVARHHANWRLKALERLEKVDSVRDLALTAPMTLAVADVERVRAILVEAVEKILKLNAKSDSEEIHFLCVDWMKL